MAKSIRAKAKMANRRKKREGGNYHAADAARVQRISAKLLGKQKSETTAEDAEGTAQAEGEEDEEMDDGVQTGDKDADEAKPKVSTSGPRSSRRTEWRESKGMVGRPKRVGQNKEGVAKARFKAGRNKRRR